MNQLRVLFIIFLSANCFAQHTVVIQPHFAHGIYNGLSWADTTNPSCTPTNPRTHEIDSVRHGYGDFMVCAWTGSGCPDFVRSLLRFDELHDTTVIPHGSVASSAKLIIYGESSSPSGNWGNSYYPGTPYTSTNEAWVYELADTFNTFTVTARKQPPVKHADSIAIPASTSRWNQNDTIDVTAFVNDMIAHVNTGFELRLQNESYYREQIWASNLNTDSTLHPKLIVTYIPTEINLVDFRNEDVTVFPSPVNDQLNIKLFALNPADVTIRIANIAGAKMDEIRQHCEAGNNQFSVNAANYPAGIYLVHVADNYSSFTQKFVKLQCR